MNVREACDRVLGKELSASITDDMGLHWTVVAAIADCKVSHGPAVKATFDAYLAAARRESYATQER